MPPKAKKQTPIPLARPLGLSILERIRPIGFNVDDPIKLLVYGKSGTGKTVFWSSFPAPILSVIVSGSDEPGEARSIDTADNRERIHQVALIHSAELPELMSWLYSGESGYQTFTLDHVTGLQDRILAEMLGLERLPEQKSWGLATQQTWGQVGSQIKDHMRAMLNLRMNVVMVGQERNFNEDSGSDGIIKPFVGPNLSPQTAAWLCPAVDYIVHTYIRQREETRKVTLTAGNRKEVREQRVPVPNKVDFCMRIAPHATYMTKFRKPYNEVELPSEIVNPTYDQIMALVRGETAEN